MANKHVNQFGGEWTQRKLGILRNYLDAYTTALKNQPFRLLYIDAFAGSGEIGRKANDPDINDLRAFIDGSARISLNIKERSFDRLIFIDKDPQNCTKLEELRNENPDRSICIVRDDANHSLKNLKMDWHRWRGVLFLDPFGAQVDWVTLEAIAEYKALDTWILFPTSAIVRMLPESKVPGDISEQWSSTLTRVYGNESWRNLYTVSPDKELFPEFADKPKLERERGVKGLIKIYKEQLGKLFETRFLDQSIALKNAKKSSLYEFMFCVGSNKPAAIETAKKIAKYLLKL